MMSCDDSAWASLGNLKASNLRSTQPQLESANASIVRPRPIITEDSPAASYQLPATCATVRVGFSRATYQSRCLMVGIDDSMQLTAGRISKPTKLAVKTTEFSFVDSNFAFSPQADCCFRVLPPLYRQFRNDGCNFDSSYSCSATRRLGPKMPPVVGRVPGPGLGVGIAVSPSAVEAPGPAANFVHPTTAILLTILAKRFLFWHASVACFMIFLYRRLYCVCSK